MTDTEFAWTLANLTPVDEAWKSFNRSLREKMDMLTASGTPMNSATVIERIKEEHWAQHAHDPDTVAEVLGTEALVRKRRLPAEATARAKTQNQTLCGRASVVCYACGRPKVCEGL